MMRNATRKPKSVATWVAKDATRNKNMANGNVRFGPMFPTNQPFSNIANVLAAMKPVETQCTNSWPTP